MNAEEWFNLECGDGEGPFSREDMIDAFNAGNEEADREFITYPKGRQRTRPSRTHRQETTMGKGSQKRRGRSHER